MERQWQDKDGSYPLPNDSPEHDRLDKQVEAFARVMDGKTFHAQIPASPRKILDVGCGTGILTHQLAAQYPEAQVIGVDISPVPVHRHGALPNLKYIQADITKVVEEDQENFAAGSFDYIFQRLLLFAITDWPSHVQRLSNLLASGGYLELHDICFEVHAGSNHLPYAEDYPMSDDWSWHATFRSDCAAMGLDIEVGKSLAGYLSSSSTGKLTDVKEIMYKIPPGGPRVLDQSSEAYWKQVCKTQELLMDRICGPPQNSAKKIERLKEEMLETFGKTVDGDWLGIFVVVGRRGVSQI